MKNAFFNNLIKVNDIYFISEQIKEINKNFQLFYNVLDCKYYVYDTQKNCVCVSFNKYPNQELINKLKYTSIENSITLFKQIDDNNQKLENSKNDKIEDDAKQKIKEIINYTSKTTHDISSNQINKIIN